MHASHTCLGGVIHAETFTAGEAAVLTASSKDSTNIADGTEQCLLTVNKDANVSSVTVKVDSTTISPVTSGGNTYWVDKGANPTITATYKDGYTGDTGTGNTGEITTAKTIAIKSCPALKFSSDSNFNLSAPKLWDGTLQYSTNNGSSWSTWDGSQLSGTASKPIYLRGTGNSKIVNNASDATESNCHYWAFTGKHCTGNIETLLDYQKVINGQHPTMAANCYNWMFYNCKTLVTPPELPATTLTEQCYACMFGGCTSLTTTPELPAKVLGVSSYASMFFGCTSLTTAPKLPATTLASNCYYSMFNSCTALTVPPSLPATTLAEYCYRRMFYGCIKLKVRADGSGTKIFTCPSNTGSMKVYEMFTNTGGVFTGTPTSNKTYYYY